MQDVRTLVIGGIALVIFCGIRTWRCFRQAYIQAPKQIELLRKANDLENVARWEEIRKKSRDVFQINGLMLTIALLLMCMLALSEFFAYLAKPT